MKGVVLGGANNVFRVECADGVIRRCGIKGKILKSPPGRWYNPLAPGDEVEAEADGEAGRITALRERRNAFGRWNEKGRAPQLLAANLDALVLVTTPDEPPFRPRFIDRALCQAEEAGLEAVIALNKCDLLPAGDAPEALLADWERAGYRCLAVSAARGDGLPALAALLAGRTAAFAGQSGVGKSSLVNALGGSALRKTGALSQKYGRGNHTTAQGELLRLPLDAALAGRAGAEASVIDTPGVRRFVPGGIAGGDVPLYFREIRPLVGTCAFGMSCSHTGEAGCAVKAAVEAGAVPRGRYESMLLLQAELRTR